MGTCCIGLSHEHVLVCLRVRARQLIQRHQLRVLARHRQSVSQCTTCTEHLWHMLFQVILSRLTTN